MACMCRALFDFSANHAGSLTVHQGETFLVLLEANRENPHWWFVVNGQGQMGYVPKSYVNIEEVSEDCLKQEIDDLLELLHSDPCPTTKNRNLLKSLIKMRDSFRTESRPQGSTKKRAPKPPLTHPPENGSTENTVDCRSFCEQSPTESANSPITNQTQSPESDHCFNSVSCVLLPNVEKDDIKSDADVKDGLQANINGIDRNDGSYPTGSDSKEDLRNYQRQSVSEKVCVDTSTQTSQAEYALPPVLVPDIVDRVRSQTHLSYSKSILAVLTAMETLAIHLPHLSVLCDSLTKELSTLKTVGISSSQIFVSRDREHLLSVFHRLWSCKEDSEQRSWPLQEDETIILEELDHLKQLLLDADSHVCCEVIQLQNYECVHTLVTYYQMEARRCLRIAVLGVLQLMCFLDFRVIEQLLISVLPTELVLDITNHSTDRERFMVSAQLLSTVFSTGQFPPRTVYAHLNVSFVSWVLNQLESILEDKIDEEMANLYLSVLLAINLHLLPPEENFVLEGVRIRSDTPVALTEKLMLLINREEDPVFLPTSSDDIQHTNSVLKFLLDLFADPVCAQHFYVNDIKVLLDIIVRQLTDLPASIKRRLDYLKLTNNIVTNTNYIEHKHQQAGLASCLEWLLEHEEFSPDEKDFSHTIISTFPDLFDLT